MADDHGTLVGLHCLDDALQISGPGETTAVPGMCLAGTDFVEQDVHDGQHLARLHGDEKDLILTGLFVSAERSDIDLPGHRILGPDIVGPAGARGAFAQRSGVGERHQAAHLVFLGDDDGQVLLFGARQLAEKVQHRPDHDNDDDQHEAGQVGQRRP